MDALNAEKKDIPKIGLAKEKKKISGKKIISMNKRFKKMLIIVRKFAGSNFPVLVEGETGTGKELIARFIHDNSSRIKQKFLAINCSTLQSSLIASELFGHVKGAFTGAFRDKKGIFENAEKGTVFLDEIGELPLDIQAMLLRGLQEGTIRKVGSSDEIPVNVRIICAANKNLNTEVAKKKFREDIYYRLNACHVHIPPLRERKGDIPFLAEYFLGIQEQEQNKNFIIDTETLEIMQGYNWPGNVRELENNINVATLLCEDSIITPELMDKIMAKTPKSTPSIIFPANLKMAERKFRINLILTVLAHTNNNNVAAAQILGMRRGHLGNLKSKLGITKEMVKNARENQDASPCFAIKFDTKQLEIIKQYYR